MYFHCILHECLPITLCIHPVCILYKCYLLTFCITLILHEYHRLTFCIHPLFGHLLTFGIPLNSLWMYFITFCPLFWMNACTLHSVIPLYFVWMPSPEILFLPCWHLHECHRLTPTVLCSPFWHLYEYLLFTFCPSPGFRSPPYGKIAPADNLFFC
jgi:hypothetical protein